MSHVTLFRQIAKDIIKGRLHKKVVICGPCSIHDVQATLHYAKEIKKMAHAFQDEIFLVMRVFLEKPRTKNDWRGFINDPDLDGTLNIEKGINQSLYLLKELDKMGIAIATEFIDPNFAVLTQEFITWGFIGARTVRSPIHRQLAAFLNMPIGFKNPLDGDLETLHSAIEVAGSTHKALYPSRTLDLTIQSTNGNRFCHGVLRGSVDGPNYHQACYFENICMIDCAHGNSSKTIEGMKEAFYKASHITLGHKHVIGLMLESFINKGSQIITQKLDYGVSITDPCLDIQTTFVMLEDYYKLLSQSHGSSSNFIESCLMSGSSSDT